MVSIFQKQAMEQLNELKANPAKFLISRHYNIDPSMVQSPQKMIESITGIPITQEYASNPNAYFQYLLTNGGLSQQQQAQMQNTAKFFNL